MNKKVKKFIIYLYVSLFVIAVFLIFSIFTSFGQDVTLKIFLPKHYIKFNDLDKVKVCYNSNGFANEKNVDETYCEVEITDKHFLKLLEDTYQYKIVNNYFIGGILSKGKYKIIINDDIELYTCGLNGFILEYDNSIILVKFEKDIYEKMIDIIEIEK